MREAGSHTGAHPMHRWGWLVVVLAVVVVYWPLSTLSFGMDVHDAKNCWMPWRWLVASALQDGHFPVWAPYHQFGYPLFADLQGPAWYLEAIALGGTIGHDAYTLQLLYLLYLCIGGVGMQRVALRTQNDPTIAVVIGVAYALGGFFTAHQMHFYAVISAAWLPWVFRAVLDLLQQPGWRPALRVAVFQALLLTGGNHTFTIISVYLFAALAVVQLWQYVSRKDMVGLRSMLLYGSLAVVLLLPMASGTLLAAVEVVPLMSRGEGLSLERAAFGSTTWGAWRSMWMPYAIGTDPDQLGTLSPMTNGYMGLIMVAMAGLSLFRRRSAVENTLLVFGGFCFLASLGTALPVYPFIWEYLPGMDLFRFPAYFRWFLWLAVLYSASCTLHAWRLGELPPRAVRTALLIMLGAALLLVPTFPAAALANGGEDGLYGFMTALPQRTRAWMVLPVLVLSVAVLCRATVRPGFPAATLLACVLLEMGWNTTLSQWNTAVSTLRPALIAGRTAPLTKGPIVPEGKPLAHFRDDGTELHYLMYNSQDFLGHPVHGGYNSFWLANADSLEVRHAGLWHAMAKQPLAYFADSIIAGSVAGDAPVDSGLVVVHPDLYRRLPQPAGRAKASIVAFDQRSIGLICHAQADALLVLQQSAYPGWSVTVDGAPALWHRVNVAAMGVLVPEGTHTVEFRFAPAVVSWAPGLSLGTQLLAMLLLALSGPCRWPRVVGVLVLSGAVAWSVGGHTPKAEQLPKDLAAILEKVPGADILYCNTDRELSLPAGVRSLRAETADRLSGMPVESWPVEGWWLDAGLATHRSVRSYLLDRAEVVEYLQQGRVEAVRLRPRTGPEPGTLLGSWADRGPRTMDRDAQFNEGFKVQLDTLDHTADADLVADLVYSGAPDGELSVIMEVLVDGRQVEYRNYPLPPAAPDGARSAFHAVCPLRELDRPGAEVHVYLWHRSGEAVQAEAFRLRCSTKGMAFW